MRTLVGLRASELARCPRQCALRGLGAEPSPPSERAKRWMARGQMYGIYAAEQFKAKYGPESVAREVEIPWGDGWTGHADLLVKPQRLIVEVVSSTSPDGIFGSKVRQARQYLHFAQQAGIAADRAAVYLINPSDLDREYLVPVLLRDSDREEIDRDVESVRAALSGGPLPACCAASPTECRRSLLCPFTDQAWQGWEPPAAVDLSADTEAVELAQRLYLVKTRRARRKVDDDADDEQQKELQAGLVERGLLPGLEYVLHGIRLKRTECKGRETFSYAMARKAGVVNEELLAPFVKVGASYDRWSVARTEASMAALGLIDEFGDEAPF